MKQFHERLQEIMQNNKINYKELANKLNVTKATMSNYKCGKIQPTLKHFKEMCIILDVSADYLIGLSDF